VIDVLSDLFILHGIPAHIRSDNGPEFVAKALQEWIAVVGAKTAYIERGSPWENGYYGPRRIRFVPVIRRLHHASQPPSAPPPSALSSVTESVRLLNMLLVIVP
jgi:hypothetical protein